jgi:hypothetical protein
MSPEEVKDLSRGRSTDTSSEAILRRLDIASELFELVGTLSNAQKVGTAEEVISNSHSENQAESRD